MLAMPSAGTSVLIFLLAVYFSLYFVAKPWAESAQGYAIGNRYRFVSVLKLEIVMVFLNVFVYKQLMHWFVMEEEMHRNKYGASLRRHVRDRCSTALIIFVALGHACYFMYYAPPWLQWVLFDVTTLSLGLWTNMLGFVCGFFLVNVLIGPFNSFPPLRWLIALCCRINYVKGLVYDRREQIKFTLWFSCLLSVLMWYGCDKVVVKERHLAIKDLTADGGQLKVAIVSDIHAGASVYKDQVDRVVDALLPLSVDAVLIVGDMVDGEVKNIEERVAPFWLVAQRFPTFFVSGNHEYYYGDVTEWLRLYTMKGINVLSNNATMFRGVCLAGVNDIASFKSGIVGHRMNFTTALSHCPPAENASRIVMAHNPASIREIEKEELSTLDLIVSGHTHAGQFYVVVPMVYWMLPYFYGLYDLPAPSHGKLLVTAGSLYQGPPMKMLRMSEIWVLTLTKA